MKSFNPLLVFLKKTLLNVFENLEVIIIAAIVFISPLIVDYSILPKGFELPKVTFTQLAIVVLIFVYINKELFKVFTKKDFTKNKHNHTKNSISSDSVVKDEVKLELEHDIKLAGKLLLVLGNFVGIIKLWFKNLDKSILVLLFTLLLVLITTILSPFQEIAIYGNSFRFQGAITHMLLILLAFILYKKGNKGNLALILWALFLSAIIQSASAFSQLIYFIENNPKVIFEGYFINGTFGQANFYSGRIALGILAGIFIISSSSTKYISNKGLKFFLSIVHYLLLPLTILFIISGLLISFSIWGIITSSLMVSILVVYEIFRNVGIGKKRNIFGYLIGILIFLGIIIGSFFLREAYLGAYNLRLDIWQQIIKLSTSDSLIHVLFGYGFDTLGETFRLFGSFPNSYIDRAHNFFLDIYSQNGLLSLLTMSIIIFISILKFIFKKSNRLLTYFFIGLIVWLFRSFIHESGIVNLFDFLVLFGAVLALQKDIKLDLKLPRLINHKRE